MREMTIMLHFLRVYVRCIPILRCSKGENFAQQGPIRIQKSLRDTPKLYLLSL